MLLQRAVIETDPPAYASCERGGHPPTVREHVLRGRADVRGVPTERRAAIAEFVVILRLRERTDIGSTFIDVLRRYAEGLNAVGSKLVIVSVNERLGDQLRVTGLVDVIGVDNVYRSTERVGGALDDAYRDAMNGSRPENRRP